jgi:membrane protein YqaA with SNARE-associated domain
LIASLSLLLPTFAQAILQPVVSEAMSLAELTNELQVLLLLILSGFLNLLIKFCFLPLKLF